MRFARTQPEHLAPAGPAGGDYAGGGGMGSGSGPEAVGGSGPAHRLNLLLTAPRWRPDTWADRLPVLLEPLGVAAVRAQSARAAERAIRTLPIHIAVVDLSLPLDDADSATAAEESGTRILDLLSRLDAPPPTVVVQSPRGQREATRCMNTALRCGAFAVVDRSAADLELMLGIMQRALRRFYNDQWPGTAPPPTGLEPRRGRVY